MTKHPKLTVLVGVAISVISLWLALRQTNLSEINASIARMHVWMALPMLFAYAVFYWLKLIRWQLILFPIKRASARQLFSPMMLGFFGNNILPAHIGEFIRMYLGAKVLNLSNTQVLATLVLERIFDVLSVVVILVGILYTGINLSGDLETAGYITGTIGLVIICSIVISIVWTPLCLRIIDTIMCIFPKSVRKPILHHIELGLESFHAIKSPYLLLGIVVTSITQWLFMGVTIFLALLSTDVDAGLAASFVVLAFTVFAVIVPAAPGFFGTIQLAFVLSLAPFGISKAEAIAASVSFHVLTYFSVLLLGFYLLHRLGYHVKSLTDEATADPEIL